MNIILQLCGLIITSLMLILYLSHKRLHLMGERVFLFVIIMSTICISLDALSIVAIHYRANLPIILVDFVCKLYLISMMFVGWVNIGYISLDLTTSMEKHRKMSAITGVLTIIESIIVLILPIYIYESGSEVYTYGPAVVATYIFTIISIISILIVAVYILKNRNARRGTAEIITTSLWIIAAVIQFLNNELLLVGFSMAVGIMVLYIVMENPDSCLDRDLGCFNSYALNNYLADKFEKGKPFGILDISIINVKNLEDHGVNVLEETKKLINLIKTDEDVFLFKNLSTGLRIISSDQEKLNNLCSFISKTISTFEGVNNSISILLVENAQQFKDVNEITKFLSYMREKDAGRLSSTVYVSDDMIKRYHDMKEIEKEIDLALEEDRVEAFFQPICSVSENRPTSAEALARIRKKDGSLLSPGIFIPVAESTGQILRIGDRILEKVCELIRDSEVTKLGIDTIHVNLSAVQCDDVNAATNLNRIVEKYGIDKSYISFEITETAASSSKDTLIENMNILTSMGYKFALDDFGKGESNLMYIVDMPIDILKYDMDLTKAFFNNDKAKVVVSAISKMASELRLPIVAEGIETKEELNGLANEGVSMIQGYYYSKPLPAKEFVEYVRNFKNEEQFESNVTETVVEEKHETISIGGNRILLVEDNEMNAEITQEILEDSGFEVDIADDGTVAVDIMSKAKDNDYNLILMDIRMPIMDGYEATRRIRSMDKKAIANIPIIALTAQNTEDDRNATKDAGMNYHLIKPIDIREFNELIKINE